jgi:hypothetical protein
LSKQEQDVKPRPAYSWGERENRFGCHRARAILWYANAPTQPVWWNCTISEAQKSTSSKSILSLVQNALNPVT